MLRQLRRRFLLDTMILALVVLIGSTALLLVAGYTFSQNTANDTMTNLLADVTPETVTLKEGKDGKVSSAEIDWKDMELRDEVAILLYSEDGELLSELAPGRTMAKEVKEDRDEIREVVLNAEKPSGLIPAKPLRYMKMPLEGVGTKVAVMDRSGELTALYFQFRVYIVLAFIILILILILCDFLARRSILPVDEAIRNQQQFIADASHELKTPLTIILANLEILTNQSDKTIRESEKWIESTKSETRRMSKLVNEMLFLARSDAAMDMHYNFRLINLTDVVEEVVMATEALAFERNITLLSDLPENTPVVGDFERLKQVVMILLENATKYVDENGTIEVRLAPSSRRSELLTITNTGTPIPPDKSSHIFDRFYRVDESRVREQGGYGLGLSIAQKIVQKHNGEIALEYSDERGTCFSVRLPGAQSLRAPDLSVPAGKKPENGQGTETA